MIEQSLERFHKSPQAEQVGVNGDYVAVVARLNRKKMLHFYCSPCLSNVVAFSGGR